MARKSEERQTPFHSRELSWMDFNTRVLEQAARPDYPVLERLKYLAISASNLDEFVMVRVAYLHDKVKDQEKKAAKRDDAGLTAREQLAEVLERVGSFQRRQSDYLQRLREELATKEIRVHRLHQLDDEQLAHVEKQYFDRILPVLTPLAVDPARPFPFLNNKSLYLGVRLQDEEGEERFGLVQIPPILPRFLPLPCKKGAAFLPLEELVARHLDSLFGLYERKAWGVFRLTRSADFDADEDTDDLLEEMKRTIKKRKRGKPIRLELSLEPLEQNQEGCADFDKKLCRFLIKMLAIHKRYVFKVPGLLDLEALSRLITQCEGRFEHLHLPPIEPAPPVDFADAGQTIFEKIGERDRLVLHPYESFDCVVNFISAAAEDPAVLAIKQTLYRVSGNSQVVAALEQAAEAGKQVTVLVELRARFDEEKNIQWSGRLEKAGCHVVYGLAGLKTHCKVTLVVRMEGEGIRRYVHLGTGNYNDATAKLYTDAGLFTADPAVGADASDLFNHLTGFSRVPQYRKLVVAPQGMKPFFLEKIGREIENARSGKASGIYCKVNSLLDGRIVRELYEASRAGVPVRLLVRGICSLVPGVAGYSETIQVHSIVGQLLEHSRVFCFENGGEPQVYLGSADLMPRNLERRVEVVFPVEEPLLRDRVVSMMELLWRDNVDAWEQESDGSYRQAVQRGQRICAQRELARLSGQGWRTKSAAKGKRGRQKGDASDAALKSTREEKTQ